MSGSGLSTNGFLRAAPWFLAGLMAAVLYLYPPQFETLHAYLPQCIAYAMLTALALVFGALLTEGEFSVAHAVGMMAFLSFPQENSGALLWSVFGGGLLGSGLLASNTVLRLAGRDKGVTLKNIVFQTARVTLSLGAAGSMYTGMGGRLPFDRLKQSGDPLPVVLVIAIFCVVYITIYTSLFALELHDERRSVSQIFQANFWQLMALLLLPIPFAVLGADVSKDTDMTGFTTLVTGLSLVVIGLHAYSRSERRLRKQLDELRSLSVVTQAMRAHLNLDTLLKTVYLQVANLLNVENFLVALVDLEEKILDYPLVIRNGTQEENFSKSKETLDTVLLKRVLETRAPLLLRDSVYEHTQEMGLNAPRELVYSWLGVPLLAGGYILGAMVVTSRDPRQRFNTDDLRLLNIVAASASIAVENAQLYQRQTERANRLATLNNIASLLTGTLSPDAVLDTIISSASTIGRANAIAVYLFWDDAQATLALARSGGLSDAFLADPPEPLLTDMADTKMLYKQLPLVVHDMRKEKRAVRFIALMEKERKNAWIELPLAVGETVLGVLVVYFDEVQTPDSENVELLRTFSAQAAQAISNARRYTQADEALERRVEQLFALAAMGRLLTATMDTKQISDTVLGYATDATKASCGLIALRNEKTNKLEIMSKRGYPENTFNSAELLLQGLTGEVLENGRVARSGNVRQEPGYLPVVQTTRSQLAVPILRGREIIGVIRLESPQTNAFSEEDSYFVGQIANQTVIAINNVQLFQRITEARDRLQILLDTMEEAIILLDSLGYIVLANPRVSLLSLKSGELIDQNISTLFKKPELKLEDRLGFASEEQIQALLKEVSTSGVWHETDSAPYAVEGEHGLLYIQRQIIPVKDSAGSNIGVLLVFYNKTDEHELTQAREELSQMIIHDLRSPLTAVTTSMRLLRELVPQDSDFKQIVDSTTDASQRAIRKLLSRVDALLDISKMERGQLTLDIMPSELATLADSVCVELSPLAHELNVQVTSQIPETLPMLEIDPDKVERLLLNMVDNALKYAPAHSKVVIRAYEPGQVGAKDHFVRVEVVDQGPGIPDEYKKRLFDRYVQIEGRRKVRRGVGLGLTFCKMVTEAHGGRIWIEDNPGGGSIFVCTLPAARLLNDE